MIDPAPFHLAVKNGYFQAEGPQVEFSTAASGPASVATTAYSSYPPFLTAHAQNAADIKIIADGPSTTVVLAMPGSSVRGIAMFWANGWRCPRRERSRT